MSGDDLRGEDRPRRDGTSGTPSGGGNAWGARRLVPLLAVVLLVAGALVVAGLLARGSGPEPGTSATSREEPVDDPSEPDRVDDPDSPTVPPGEELEGEPDSEEVSPGSGAAVTPGTVPDGALPTAAPVALGEEAEFGPGVRAVLDAVDGIQTEARVPGEISGPGLAFTIRITNATDAPIALGAVTVNLFDADGTPGLPMSGPPGRAFDGDLAPGDAAVGTYVFTTGAGRTTSVRLEVSFSTEAPVVVFEGDPATV